MGSVRCFNPPPCGYFSYDSKCLGYPRQCNGRRELFVDSDIIGIRHISGVYRSISSIHQRRGCFSSSLGYRRWFGQVGGRRSSYILRDFVQCPIYFYFTPIHTIHTFRTDLSTTVKSNTSTKATISTPFSRTILQTVVKINSSTKAITSIP